MRHRPWHWLLKRSSTPLRLTTTAFNLQHSGNTDHGIGGMRGNLTYWHSTTGSKPDGTNAPDLSNIFVVYGVLACFTGFIGAEGTAGRTLTEILALLSELLSKLCNNKTASGLWDTYHGTRYRSRNRQ